MRNIISFRLTGKRTGVFPVLIMLALNCFGVKFFIQRHNEKSSAFSGANHTISLAEIKDIKDFNLLECAWKLALTLRQPNAQSMSEDSDLTMPATKASALYAQYLLT